MPLLIVDRVTVLNDLPVTLPSLLSDSSWNSIAESLVQNLWASTERIYAWAMQLANNDSSLGPESIDSSESCRSGLLARVMLNTCVSLKDYLSFEQQSRLANMVIAWMKDEFCVQFLVELYKACSALYKRKLNFVCNYFLSARGFVEYYRLHHAIKGFKSHQNSHFYLIYSLMLGICCLGF